MTLHVPLLTEVYLRAWGIDDPRVLSPLRAENQPAHTLAAAAVRKRAIDAGYPVLDLDDRRRAASAAMRRLEGTDWTWTGDRNHHLFLRSDPNRFRDDETVDYDGEPISVAVFDE